MQLDDTIVAVSSTTGGGGVRAIVRLSGDAAHALTRAVMTLPPGAVAGFFADVDILGLFDSLQRDAGYERQAQREVRRTPHFASVLLFESPKSFTGQDVAELHIPNSPALIRWLIQQILAAGAGQGTGSPVRMAEAGEFSARAFFNGKVDLTEAEGIAATIHASSQMQLRAAAGLRDGDLHKWTQATAERLANLLALIEAGIDFVEEEGIQFINAGEVESTLTELVADIQRQLVSSIRIDRLDAPPTVVFIGKPNVGKSSLINALAGRERSIVSPTAGTTRDALAVMMDVSGYGAGQAVRLLDVPGEEATTDEMRENMMAARGRAMLDADLVVHVTESTQDMTVEPNSLNIRNKADLLTDAEISAISRGESWRCVSAKSGLHVEQLREAISQAVTRGEAVASGRLVLNQRHRALLQATLEVLAMANELLRKNAAERHPELLAAELRRALDLIGQITGTISPDDVLGRVFSQFCIGK